MKRLVLLSPFVLGLLLLFVRQGAANGITIYKNEQHKPNTNIPLGDYFEGDPEILSNDENGVRLRLYPLRHSYEPNAKNYFVVVFKRWELINNRVEYTAANYEEKATAYYSIIKLPVGGAFRSGTILEITVGDGVPHGPFVNPKLEKGKEYSFAIVANINPSKNFYRSTSNSIIAGGGPGNSATVFHIVVISFLSVLLVVTLVILGILIYINQTGDERLHSLVSFWVKPDKRSQLQVPVGLRDRRRLLYDEFDQEASEGFVERGIEMKSHPVPISELSEYFSSMFQNDGFKQEYLSVPRGQSAKWDSAKLEENKSKNRYGNLLAYEHSRVTLTVDEEPESGATEAEAEPRTDYINSNWIDGYKQPRRYIATQGPMSNTTADFWRMVWQTESRTIVMLTNLEELGRNKCDRYWPENATEHYGPYHVSMVKKEPYADFIIRKFALEKGGQTREVIQYHFVSWPDHAVPVYSCSLISFINKMRASATYSHKDWPIIVHCSAGVGRTGTLMLIDTMLEMALHEKHVDVLAFLCVARANRVNMVEKLSQYIFVHQILVEALCHDPTDIDCNQLDTYMHRLKILDPQTKTPFIDQQFQTLNKLTRHIGGELCSTAAGNATLNRSAEILPPNYSRVILETSAEHNNDYVNAVYVNGYKRRDAYIVTEVPVLAARQSFWLMVAQSGVKTIVLLNEVSHDDIYWPNELNAPTVYGSVEVRLIREEHVGYLAVRSFQLPDGHIVRQFQMKSWSPGAILPRDAQQLVDLLARVDKWLVESSSSSKLVVQCFNGARACGIYCSASFICERIKEEHQVDVFLASRTTRTQRPQFIESIEQYNFLYEIARCYLENFEIYANFK